MANSSCIAATGRSIERLIDAWLRADQPITGKIASAKLVRAEDLDAGNTLIVEPALSIYFYRLAPNAVMRSAWGAQGSLDGRGHLPLDLHFLLTAWGENAEHELLLLGKALECLESTPLLSGPLLHPSGGWETGDVIQLLPDELAIDSLISLFDSLDHSFRLSAPYMARSARIDGERPTPPADVLTAIAGMKP